MSLFPGKSAPLPDSAQKKLKSRTSTAAGDQTGLPGDGGKRMDIFSTSRTATPSAEQKPLKSRPGK